MFLKFMVGGFHSTLAFLIFAFLSRGFLSFTTFSKISEEVGQTVMYHMALKQEKLA